MPVCGITRSDNAEGVNPLRTDNPLVQIGFSPSALLDYQTRLSHVYIAGGSESPPYGWALVHPLSRN